jgi:hypothetical protein
MQAAYNEVLDLLYEVEIGSFYYILIETKYTRHYIEKFMPTCADRGKWKWIAVNYGINYQDEIDEEGHRSHIDGSDCFPRLFFQDDSMCNELFAWLQMRDLEIINIKAVKI